MTTDAQPNTRLQGYWLAIARVTWIALAVLTVSTLTFAVIIDHTFASTLDGWTPEAYRTALKELGLSANSLDLYHLIIATVIRTVYIVISAVIFWRKADDRMAFFLSVSLLTISVTVVWVGPIAATHPLLARPIDLLQVLGQNGLFLAFYIFPDGRFVPRWARWPTIVTLAMFVLARYNLWFRELATANAIFWVAILWLFACVPLQIYRYRRVSNLMQRQQTKWAVAGFAGFVLVAGGTWAITYAIFPAVFPSLQHQSATTLIYNFTYRQIQNFGFLALPVCFGIAILRYRLFDIDLLIRRTLQYSLLSGLLALVYFGLIIVLQSAFTAITGQQQNEFVTVLSTLAIAALSLPLRRRVQDVIDRRFYRKKYDAAKVLAEFAATARDEVELDKLTARLVEVVDETMQPESVSLWLKPTADRSARRRTTAGRETENVESRGATK